MCHTCRDTQELLSILARQHLAQPRSRHRWSSTKCMFAEGRNPSWASPGISELCNRKTRYGYWSLNNGWLEIVLTCSQPATETWGTEENWPQGLHTGGLTWLFWLEVACWAKGRMVLCQDCTEDCLALSCFLLPH